MKDFYKEIMNVEARFQTEVAHDMKDLVSCIDSELQAKQENAAMDDEMQEMLSQVEELAAQKHIDLSEEIKAFHAVKAKMPVTSDKTVLPAENFDADALFQQYCMEAHSAGFNNVHINQLLTKEELLMADTLEQQIDELFKLRTTLRDKEVTILFCATMARVFCIKLLQSDCEVELEERKQNSYGILPDSNGKAEFVAQNAEAAINLLGQTGFIGAVRDPDDIMHGRVPFDIVNNDSICRDEILGYSPGIGWIIGIINILTGTITDKNYKSFLVDMSNSSLPRISSNRVNLASLLLAVFQAADIQRDSIYCAVLREAEIQGCHIAESHDIKTIIDKSERKSYSVEELLDGVCKFSQLKADPFRESAKLQANRTLDKILSYICAVQYDSQRDGSVEEYAIRVNQILSLSAAAAAVLLGIKIEQGDLGGMVVFLAEQVESSKFWIEAKTEYLETIHRDILDKIRKRIEEI